MFSKTCHESGRNRRFAKGHLVQLVPALEHLVTVDVALSFQCCCLSAVAGMRGRLAWLLAVALLAAFPLVSAELYTAIADLEELLDTEAVYLKTLDNFLHLAEDRLNALRR